MTSGVSAVVTPPAIAASDPTQAASTQPPSTGRIIRPSDIKGAKEVGQEGCKSTSGEFSFRVHATPTDCGVPRKKAERVVLIRQPAFAVGLALSSDRYSIKKHGAA